MLFNSLQYFIFFPIVIFTYYNLKHKYRWILLLAASYYFYMCWNAKYLVLIIFSTIVDYISALLIERYQNKNLRKLFLCSSLFCNLGLLFFFKYYVFVTKNISLILNSVNIFNNFPVYNYLLPVGISFYTFQTLSYTIDVYRGEKKAEKHLGIFALYVSFFPQLVAGPIERSTRLIPQFYKKIKFDYNRTRSGLLLIIIGLFKKIVIADRLAVVVDSVYSNPNTSSSMGYIIATVFFAFQILCDFSGYSDIAIGSAKILGFDLMINFRRPYFAISVSEFWKRWHISLSTWFRDYLYISLGGNRKGFYRMLINIIIVFFLSGLWHGANWTFLVWGLINGIYLIIEVFGKRFINKSFIQNKRNNNFIKTLKIIFIFILINFSWIFFRAANIKQALNIIHKIYLDIVNFNFQCHTIFINVNKEDFILGIVLILILILYDWYEEFQNDIMNVILNKPVILRWSYYYLLCFSIIILGKFNNSPFLYFQF